MSGSKPREGMIKSTIFIEDGATDIWLTVTQIKAINADLTFILP